MRPGKVLALAGGLLLLLLTLILANPASRQVLQEVNVNLLAEAEEQGLMEVKMPMGAANVVENGCEVDGRIVGEIRFKIDGVQWVYHCGAVGGMTDPLTDVSGMDGDFAHEQVTEVRGCPAVVFVNDGENGKIIWMDPDTGAAYSLTVADNGDGDALQSLANFMHTPLG